MLLGPQGRRIYLLTCTVQAGWFHLSARVQVGSSLGGDKVNQAGFSLTGSKRVSSEMLAVLRPLNIICFVLKD